MAEADIEAGALVILHCMSPKEKIWGVLRRIDSLGIVIRGLDLNSFEDWFQQELAGDDPLIGPSTQFVPMHRVERIYLDESNAAVDSFGDRFTTALGCDVRGVLLAGLAAEGEEQ